MRSADSMNSILTVREQFRRNAVALISLTVAVTSLGYNTWRNEASEHNRNQRLVSIELLLMLGDLQQLTLDRHYGKGIDAEATLREAWSKVLTRLPSLSSQCTKTFAASTPTEESEWFSLEIMSDPICLLRS